MSGHDGPPSTGSTHRAEPHVHPKYGPAINPIDRSSYSPPKPALPGSPGGARDPARNFLGGDHMAASTNWGSFKGLWG